LHVIKKNEKEWFAVWLSRSPFLLNKKNEKGVVWRMTFHSPVTSDFLPDGLQSE
jgi:hypothetical protein